MSDDIVPDQLLTIPAEELKPKPSDLKQTIIRLHKHDHAMLRAMLRKDRLSMQKFIGFCVKGYLDADPFMLKMLKNYRELQHVPAGLQEQHVLSHRERAALYEEIEKSGGFDIPKGE